MVIGWYNYISDVHMKAWLDDVMIGVVCGGKRWMRAWAVIGQSAQKLSDHSEPASCTSWSVQLQACWWDQSDIVVDSNWDKQMMQTVMSLMRHSHIKQIPALWCLYSYQILQTRTYWETYAGHRPLMPTINVAVGLGSEYGMMLVRVNELVSASVSSHNTHFKHRKGICA